MKNRELVTKGKNFCVEGGTVLKGGGDQSEECDENSVHRGSEHDLHKDHNLRVSSSDGVFGNHTIEKAWSKLKQLLRATKARTADVLEQAVGKALAAITAENASAWFQYCGYGIQK